MPTRSTKGTKRSSRPKSTAARSPSTRTGRSATASSRARKTAATSAFMRPLQPDDALSAIVGKKPLPRTQVTKKVWAYIKRHDLQDSTRRTFINTDPVLKAVCGGKRQIDMFQMTKMVNRHLSDV